MKKIAVIIGANGFLGRYVTRHWAKKGYEVVAVARHQSGWSGDGMFLPWDGKTVGPWALALEGAAVVVNLAGRSVNCRYNEQNKAEILHSRLDSTRAVGEAIRQCQRPPALWINASTATIYRDAVDGPQDEWKGEPGSGFSVDVARQWEETFFRDRTPAAVRKIAIRTAIVMADEPRSAFRTMKTLTRMGLGGTMGRGTQRVSWIHMSDFLDALDFLVANPLLDGVFNLAAPQSLNNRDFQRILREQIAMPIGLPSAGWMIRLGAVALRTEAELLLKSRWAEPARLLDEGFRFRWPEWSAAADDLLHRSGIEKFFHQPKMRTVGVKAWAQA